MAKIFNRQLLASQDERLINAASRLAKVIRSAPRDPRYPDTEPRVLIVGGFVRDAVLGLHPKDIDLEVYGVSPERLEDILNQLFPGLVNTVGKTFGILKIHLADDVEFDVSIPRRESKTGKGHRGFAIASDPGMTVEQAARRRDFTINSMSADPLTGEIIDPFGGLKDLKTRILRVTDPERFQDDPLRVYRALQFAARMDLAVDESSKELMRTLVKRGDMEELAKERVWEELKKLFLKSERPSQGLRLALELDLVSRYYPELHVLLNLPQEQEWHPEGDAWTHTLLAIDHAARLSAEPARGFSNEARLIIVLGALCHDLGKAITTKEESGRIRSPGHEQAGAEPADRIMERLGVPEGIVDGVLAIVTHHLKPILLFRAYEKGEFDEAVLANAARKLLKRIYPLSWRAFLTACEADWRASVMPDTDRGAYDLEPAFRELIAKYRLDQEPTKPLIQGRDLLSLGVKPGPLMGKIIREIEQLRDDGKISTREQALDEAREIIERPDPLR